VQQNQKLASDSLSRSGLGFVMTGP
jgi:hypothetical protein